FTSGRHPSSLLCPYTTLFRSLLFIDDLNRLISFNLDDRGVTVDSVTFSRHDELGVHKFNAVATDELVILRYGTDRKSLNPVTDRSEEHTSELQSRENLVCRHL